MVVVEKSADGKTGVLVEVNSETDFVARGDEFRGFANDVAKAALGASAGTVDAVNGLKLASGETVDEKRRALIAKIGENLTVRRVTLVKAPTVVGSYVHTDSKKAALVAVEGGDTELARDLAMQVVAASPRYVTPADAPADLVAKEREIETEKAKTEPATASKPAEILAKIVDGRLNKFYEENVLVDQPFVKDPSKTIGELITEKIASIKENITIRRFTRYKMGEGIEKKQDDFAAEVASMVG